MLLLAGTLPAAVCPELTNANPSSPHTVLLETMGWLAAQMARRINRLPERDEIEFHDSLISRLREATAATTTLSFTAGELDAVVPRHVGNHERWFLEFATDEEIAVPAGTTVVGCGDAIGDRGVC